MGRTSRDRHHAGGTLPKHVRRIQLSATLAAGGSATAKFLKWNGSAWVVTTTTLTVYDALSQFAGASGTNLLAYWSPANSRWEVFSTPSNRAYGMLYYTGTGGISTSTATKAALDTAGPSSGTTLDTTNYRITLAGTGTWRLTADMNVYCDTGSTAGTHQTMRMLLQANGSDISYSQTRVDAPNLLQLYVGMSTSIVYTVPSADTYIELVLQRVSGSGTWVYTNGRLTANKVS